MAGSDTAGKGGQARFAPDKFPELGALIGRGFDSALQGLEFCRPSRPRQSIAPVGGDEGAESLVSGRGARLGDFFPTLRRNGFSLNFHSPQE